MSDKFIFLADHIIPLMLFSAGIIMLSGVINKNSEITMVGCTLAMIAIMLANFV